MSRLGTFCLASTLIMLVFATVSAQTTEITYQGSMKDGVSPANGTYDFQFMLFDLVAGGNQLGSTIPQNGIVVTNGIFTVKLDFGNQFPGASRFLEIRVRPAGGGAFTPLSPRQQVSSSPYSVQSLNATNATTATTATNALQLGGMAANQYLLTNGNGSGLTNLNAANITTGTLPIANGGTGSPTQNFVDLSTDQPSIGGNKTLTGNLTVNGNVGIGTTSPLAKFEIDAGADNDGAFDAKAIAFGYRLGGYRHWIRTRHNGILGSGNAIDFYVNNSSSSGGSTAPGVGSLFTMTLDSGNVGIGTTAPVGKLHINEPGSSNAIGALTVDVGTFGTAGNAVNSHFFKVRDLGLGGTPAFLIRGDGNVGIGTSAPASALHLNGNSGSFAMAFTNTANTVGRRGYRLAFDNDRFTFQKADDNGNFSANHVAIEQATGNVGIGTTTPAATLEVNGYTKLGSDAPSIRVKKLTGTTAATEENGVSINTGLNPSKILSISVMVNHFGDNWIGPNYTYSVGFQFFWSLNSGQVNINNAAGNSANILSKPIKILITYEQ